MSVDVWMWVLAFVLVLVGIAGAVLPAIPGVPMVFAGLLLAAWADDFQRVSLWVVGLLGFLTVLSMVVDFAATALGNTGRRARHRCRPVFRHSRPDTRTVRGRGDW